MNFTIRIVTLSIVLLSMLNSFANTYGPSVPEVSKFEPFDATNLVDLYTGDFVYTLPLLEIPGSGGSYPLAISYKAGIPTNDQASWVGLGWNLTPGFINRHVAGLPDDLYAGNILTVTKDKFKQHFGAGIKGLYTIGGEYDNAQGFSGYAKFSASYEKYGVRAEIGLRFDRSGAHFSQGISYGKGIQGQASSGVSIATGGISSTSSIQTSINSIPFSISTANGSPYIYASAQVWLVEFGFGQQCGTYQVKSYGHLYADKMIKDAELDPDFGSINGNAVISQACNDNNVKLIGSLITDFQSKSIEDYFMSIIRGDWDFFSNSMYQTEGVTEKLDVPVFKSEQPSDSKYQRPHMFLSKDGFTVNAQGLNGAMTSFRNKKQILTRTDIFNRTPENGILNIMPKFLPTYEHQYLNVMPKNLDNTLLCDDPTEKHQFRFLGEPGGSFNLNETNPNVGSKRVVYYTDAAKKFITGFSITKEDGVTYHFKKPAYSTLEVSASVYKGKDNLLDILNTGWAAFMRGSAEWPAMLFTDIGLGNMHSAAVDFGLTMNDNKYAYAWFLTGVTGPDFIDMNNNEKPDDGDFGYWVKINYSETPDVAAYEWREPVYGYRPVSVWDPYTKSERTNKGFACGIKEVYYIKSIETNSHIANFELAPRRDAYACRFQANEERNINDYYVFTSSFSDAGAMIDLKKKVNPFGKGGLVDKNTPLQRLQKITLHKKNLITGQPETETIKEIDFTYDYSLCKGTLNSDADDDANQYLGGGPGDLDADGKLTLNTVWIKGRNGEAPLSPYVFSYVREKHEAVDNPNYGSENWDRWGYYKYDGKEHMNTNAGLVGAWSLRSILTPLGAKLDIEYESDDYARVQDSIAGDALFYEGDEVPVEYEYDGLSNNNIKSITVPINVVGTSGADICRLRSGDRIEFNADLAKIRFTQADYTRFVTEIEKKYEQIKKKPITMGLGIASTILAGLDCEAQCGLPIPGPFPNCPSAVAGAFCQACLVGGPLSCLACQTQCSMECSFNCAREVVNCMETIISVGHDGVEEKAKIFASVLGDYVNIPYSGIVSNVKVLNDHFDLDDEPKKVKITFANPVPLNLKAGIGITDNLRKWFGDPLKFYDHYDCGDIHGSDQWINLDNSIRDILLRELAEVLANAGLFDGLQDIFGGAGQDIFFPMSSTLESLIGNNGLHLKIKKIQPSDAAILSQLKTGTKAALLDKDNLFATKYHNVKTGGGLRVKSIKLEDGNGNIQQWNYNYDFLGNGTGITSGVASSEPMPFGPEGMDDRVFRQEDDGNFYMASPVVGYEKVTVIGPDGSRTVSEFATPAEYPYIKKIGDNDNFSHKYFDPSMIYGKMKKKEYFAVAKSVPVYSEVYDYETTHYANAQLDPDDDDMGASVTASNVAIRNENNVDGQLPLGTIREEYQNYLMDMTITDLGLKSINFSFGGIRHNCFQYDLPGFPIKKVTTMQDGATKVVRNLIWDKYGGHPLLVAEQNSGNKWKLTEETPVYHVSGNNAMFGKNMLNQVYQTTMYNYSGTVTDAQSSDPATILTVASPVQSSVQTWSSDASIHNWMPYSAGKIYAPTSGTWVTPTSSNPAQIYKSDTWDWNVKPTTPGKSLAFSTSNDQWLNTSHVNRYDRYGKELEVSNSNGTTVSIVRGNGNEFVNAEIANADFRESSVYTGDYDEGGAYLDHDDAWGRGQYKAVGSTTPSSASVKSKPEAKHFGEAGVEVTNAYGPTRAFKLQPQRDYIFSAWIKVVAGNPDIAKNVVMGVDYRRLNGDEGWPLNLYTTDVVPSLPCSGELKTENGSDGWKLITMNVPAKKDISSIKWRAGYNYAAAWVGVPNGDNKGGNATIFIDDIRFYPKDASVKSYYYDKTIGKPIAFVDENDRAKFYEYEVLGRLHKIFDNSRALVKRFDYSTSKIRIIKPSYNQVFPVTGVLPIKWMYWRKDANLKFYFSTNNGADWQVSPFTTHTQATAGEEQKTWNIPEITTPSTEYRLKIVDESDLGTYDISERFTIANRAVLAPVGGDVIEAGTTLRIEWVFLGAQSVDIYYMEDGSIPREIARNVASATVSCYNWTIPADLPTDRNATIKLVGRDSGGNIMPPDAVSGAFTINGKSNFILKWLFGFQNYR